MRVLSLFDGIAGARQAFKNLNIDCEYYACEIDRFAIKVALENHNDIEYFSYYRESGYDVRDLLSDEWEKVSDEMREIGGYLKQKKFLLEMPIDLLIGGSPCQDLSVAKRDGKGLDGDRSSLFFEYLRLLNKIKPRFFVLENVASMKKVDKDKITECLFGIEPVKIDSALLTAQQRKRYYWVGKLQEDGSYKKVEIEQPQNQNQELQLEKDWRPTTIGSSNNRIFRKTEKISPLTASMYKGVRAAGRPLICHKSLIGEHLDEVDKSLYRMLTPIECERLQGFPDNYTDCVSNTQRYKALGNSFTVPVIEHIIKHLSKKHERN